jgi:hypothetical protein
MDSRVKSRGVVSFRCFRIVGGVQAEPAIRSPECFVHELDPVDPGQLDGFPHLLVHPLGAGRGGLDQPCLGAVTDAGELRLLTAARLIGYSPGTFTTPPSGKCSSAIRGEPGRARS